MKTRRWPSSSRVRATLHCTALHCTRHENAVTDCLARPRERRALCAAVARDIDLLRQVQALSQDEGINLAGIKRIIELENQVAALQARVAELSAAVEGAAATMRQREAQVHASYRRDLVPYQDVRQSAAIVVWRPDRDR